MLDGDVSQVGKSPSSKGTRNEVTHDRLSVGAAARRRRARRDDRHDRGRVRSLDARARRRGARAQPRRHARSPRNARSRCIAQECRVVAEEPRLRAVVATEDVARETILDAVRTLAETLHAGVFVIVDADGNLIADSAAPEADGLRAARSARRRARARERRGGRRVARRRQGVSGRRLPARVRRARRRCARRRSRDRRRARRRPSRGRPAACSSSSTISAR